LRTIFAFDISLHLPLSLLRRGKLYAIKNISVSHTPRSKADRTNANAVGRYSKASTTADLPPSTPNEGAPKLIHAGSLVRFRSILSRRNGLSPKTHSPSARAARLRCTRAMISSPSMIARLVTRPSSGRATRAAPARHRNARRRPLSQRRTRLAQISPSHRWRSKQGARTDHPLPQPGWRMHCAACDACASVAVCWPHAGARRVRGAGSCGWCFARPQPHEIDVCPAS